jgi:hypothetical protein
MLIAAGKLLFLMNLLRKITAFFSHQNLYNSSPFAFVEVPMRQNFKKVNLCFRFGSKL